MGGAMRKSNYESGSSGENPAFVPSSDIPEGGQKSLHMFEHCLETGWPTKAWCETHVVVAVSGGADSVALLRAMHSLKQMHGGRGELIVGTLNHGLRGEDAAKDTAWLKVLCEELKVRLCLETADVQSLVSEQGDGFEAAARTARYDFLRRTAETLGARFVATAHTANDQVETVLHRIVRGTGIAGLRGIQRSRPLSESVTLVRPLLGLSRSQVVEYLSRLGQSYRTDETNADTAFTRNRIRHELLPSLRAQFNPDVDAAVLRLAAQATEAEEFIHSVAATLARGCVRIDWERGARSDASTPAFARSISIDCRPFTDQPVLLIREVCKLGWGQANWPMQSMGFREWQVLAGMAADHSSTQSINLPGNVLARRENELLRLEIASSP
jgi:tRNA(Ile)-lysidine synthase